MRKLGNVISTYGKSCLVIIGDKNLKYKNPSLFLNMKVLDSKINNIGKVISVFGSRKQIYFLIRIIKEFNKYYFNKQNTADREYKIYIKD